MTRYELIVIGAGPAGLSAAIKAASYGMRTLVLDENTRPGGQLFKQIHKFFGSKEHKAKIRGFRIGETLLKEAKEVGVEVCLGATVMGIYEQSEIVANIGEEIIHIKGDNVIIATGASENMLPFEGWTLPGVIGAGAAQTMMNLHGVQPGKKILMVGSGNVGLVVSFQLLQAGCEVACVIDAASRVGGYGVHAAKLARMGVPFFTAHTIVRAKGTDCVTGAVIAEVDDHFQPIPGTEKELEVDTICMAVGLSPMSQLAKLAGCEMLDTSGGIVPKINDWGATSVPGIFAAGDVAGIEEASSAMIGGRIAGMAAAERAGYLNHEEFAGQVKELTNSLQQLREGMFAKENRGRTDLKKTDEGYALSQSLLKNGFADEAELAAFPSIVKKVSGIHPVIECTQNIPCNPCQDACKFGCIAVGEQITNLPVISETAKCSGCGMCVATCSGQAVFLVNENYNEVSATVALPYEFLPMPCVGDKGIALDREGNSICEAEVLKIVQIAAFDGTAVLTMKVPKQMAAKARFYKKGDETL